MDIRDHLRKRNAAGPPTHDKAAGDGFHPWVALKITRSVGTMWCAWVFCAIALISLPAAIGSGDVIIIVAWVAQTFLQLVLLSVIMVGQNISAAASDARAIATFNDAEALLRAVLVLQQDVTDMRTEQSARFGGLEESKAMKGTYGYNRPPPPL